MSVLYTRTFKDSPKRTFNLILVIIGSPGQEPLSGLPILCIMLTHIACWNPRRVLPELADAGRMADNLQLGAGWCYTKRG